MLMHMHFLFWLLCIQQIWHDKCQVLRISKKYSDAGRIPWIYDYDYDTECIGYLFTTHTSRWFCVLLHLTVDTSWADWPVIYWGQWWKKCTWLLKVQFVIPLMINITTTQQTHTFCTLPHTIAFHLIAEIFFWLRSGKNMCMKIWKCAVWNSSLIGVATLWHNLSIRMFVISSCMCCYLTSIRLMCWKQTHSCVMQVWLCACDRRASLRYTSPHRTVTTNALDYCCLLDVALNTRTT